MCAAAVTNAVFWTKLDLSQGWDDTRAEQHVTGALQIAIGVAKSAYTQTISRQQIAEGRLL
eukprot:1726328-Pleurochrysis_carterae.AAC.3